MNVFEAKTIYIVGFGIEGQSVYRFLRDRKSHAHIYIADKNPLSDEAMQLIQDDAHVVIVDQKTYAHIPEDIDIIIKSPGIPLSSLSYHAFKTNVTTATNLFFEYVKGMIIGVTGTKGKSTTATLIYEILKQAGKNVHLIGNIGLSALDILSKDSSDTIYVYELSSYQCETLQKSPHISVLLNIFPEHISYHGSFDQYKNAKANITKFQTENDVLIYCADNEVSRDIALSSKAKRYAFSLYDNMTDAYIKDDKIFDEKAPLCNVSDIQLIGKHQMNAVLAGILVAKQFDIQSSDLKKAMTTFKGLAYRLERVAECHGIVFYDDALSTIPESTIAALNSLAHVDTLIIGGEDRGIDFHTLSDFLLTYPLSHLIVFPDSGMKVVAYMKEKKKTLPFSVYETSNMRDAVSYAINHTKKGCICLHSPASPSFNLFKNYMDRSKQFRDSIQEICKS